MDGMAERLENMRRQYRGPDVPPDSSITTMLVRNLPRIYTLEHVLHEIEAVCPRGSFDFVYVPCDSRRHLNIRYAFVNFVQPEFATLFFHELSGRSWRFVQTAKVCRITPAYVQGLARNLAHCAVSTGIHENPHKPAVFFKGVRIPDLAVALEAFTSQELLDEAREAVQACNRWHGQASGQQAPCTGAARHSRATPPGEPGQPCHSPCGEGSRHKQASWPADRPSQDSGSVGTGSRQWRQLLGDVRGEPSDQGGVLAWHSRPGLPCRGQGQALPSCGPRASRGRQASPTEEEVPFPMFLQQLDEVVSL